MLILASLVLAIHLLWIVWVVLGAFFTRGRTFLTAFHICSLAWGFIVELSTLPCPLTLAEQFFEREAGAQPYRGAFLTHYLDQLVYPDLPELILVVSGVTVCAVNLAVYLWRFSKWHLSSLRR